MADDYYNTDDHTHVSRDGLWTFTRDLFLLLGMNDEDAAIEADVLLWANLRGVDSHGVQLIAMYIDNVEKKVMNPRPNVEVVQETAATLLVEADSSFGPPVTVFTMKRLMEKARETGIGWGLIRNLTHQGAMGYYVEMAAAEAMAGIAFVCNPPNMAPTGARKPGVHNSPLAIGVPTGAGSMLFDMATSVAAGGKIRVAQDKGISIPEDWAMDADGNPTTDPSQAATVRPFGGYKGYGLALMFETLSSIMMGRPLLSPWTHNHDDRPSMNSQNSVVAAIDIATFTDPEQYKKDVDYTVAGIKALPRQDGVEEILVPGDPEKQVAEKRLKTGIPLPQGTVQKILDAAQKFDLALPEELV